MIAVVALVMLTAVDFGPHYDRCTWVFLSLCAYGAEKEVDIFSMKGHPTLGVGLVRIDQVVKIVPLSSTEKCSIVEMVGDDTASVVGSPRDILKKINPEGCE